MAKKKGSKKEGTKKKTRIGNSKFTKHGSPGHHGGNPRYKKRYRGQGKR